MSSSGLGWYAVHAYSTGDADALLREGLAPFLRSEPGAAVRSWFFLRYWRGGPHLRIRLLLDPAEAAETLAGVSESIRTAMPPGGAYDPAQRLAVARRLAELEGTDPGTEIVADGTVRIEPYEPEYAKYGGSDGVRIAEELFFASSRVALAAIVADESFARSRVGLAFVMTMAALAAVFREPRRVADFLNGAFALWRRYVKSEVLDRWAAGASPSPQLHATVRRLFAAEPSGEPATPRLLDEWQRAVVRAMAAFDELSPQPADRVSAGSSWTAREFVLLNYLHTHCNRLGTAPAQEAYIAYAGSCAAAAVANARDEPIRERSVR